MREKLLPKAEDITKKRKMHNRWKQFVKIMACVVVFCTTYALILPAITMENDLYSEEMKQGRLEAITKYIAEIPELEEFNETLQSYEDSEDTDSYKQYFLDTRFSVCQAYGIYQVMGEDERANVSEADKMLALEYLIDDETYSFSAATTVHAVNYYCGANNSMIVRHGTDPSTLESGTGFVYWSAIVVEENARGQLYVDKIIAYDTSNLTNKTGYSAKTENGFVLFSHEMNPDASVGDFVVLDFDYKNITGKNSSGYGTITFTSDEIAKPSTDSSKSTATPTVTESADTSKLIQINLYDYKENINDKYKADNKYLGFQRPDVSIPTTSIGQYTLAFGDFITDEIGIKSVSVNDSTNINSRNADNSANRPINGVVATHLKNGYPALKTGESYDYLFSDNTYAEKINTANISGLFKYNEETGAYTFDSRKNCAQYSNNQFTLYNELLSPNAIMYPFGNFMPFNDINSATQANTEFGSGWVQMIANSALNKYQSNSDGRYTNLSTGLKNYDVLMKKAYGDDWDYTDALRSYYSAVGKDYDNSGEYTYTEEFLNKMYCIDYDDSSDFFFGMSMHMDFTQPKDGLTGPKRDQNMIFHFTGDDDVLAYIDGVLFLDLSGIHRHVGGEIDFVKGEVRYYQLDSYFHTIGDIADEPYKTVTFEEILEAAGEDASEILNDDGTFKNYTSHTFDFYYMERGSGSSVCIINSNFPLLHSNSIAVAKEVTIDDVETDALGSPDFAFQIMKADDEGNKTDQLYIGANTAYTLLDRDGNEISGTYKTDENGVFYLKAGQEAVFNDISETRGDYYVRELFEPGLEEQYEKVTINGNATTSKKEVTVGSSTFVSVESSVQSIASGSTLFRLHNEIDTKKYGALEISKDLTTIDGQADSEKEFTMQVKLSGNLLPAGTKYTVGGKEKTVNTAGEIILKAGETAKIENILASSTFEVKEAESSSAGYSVTYKVDNKDAVSTAATGVIAVSNAVKVNVLNVEKGAHVDITATKKLMNADGNTHKYKFTLTEVANINGDPLVPAGTVKEQTVDVSNKEVPVKFTLYYVEKELGGAESKDYYYKLAEATPSDDALKADSSQYIVKVTVTNKNDVMAANVSEIYKDGKEVSEATFENTLLATLSIQKKVEGASKPDTQFSFTLESDKLQGSYEATKNDEVIDGGITFVDGKANITLKAEDIIKIKGLPAGTKLTIKEDAEGYQVTYKINEDLNISGDTADITVKTGTNTVVVTNDSNYELPDTGGIGTNWYTTGGLILVILSSILLVFIKRTREA